MARIRDVKGQTELMDYMHVVTAPRVEQLEKENAACKDILDRLIDLDDAECDDAILQQLPHLASEARRLLGRKPR